MDIPKILMWLTEIFNSYDFPQDPACENKCARGQESWQLSNHALEKVIVRQASFDMIAKLSTAKSSGLNLAGLETDPSAQHHDRV